MDPIGVEPGFDILVTGDGNETLTALADGFLQSMAADLGYGAIHDGSVFVAHRERPLGGEQACQIDTVLLAGRQNVKRQAPRRRAGKTDRRQQQPRFL